MRTSSLEEGNGQERATSHLREECGGSRTGSEDLGAQKLSARQQRDPPRELPLDSYRPPLCFRESQSLPGGACSPHPAPRPQGLHQCRAGGPGPSTSPA